MQIFLQSLHPHQATLANSVGFDKGHGMQTQLWQAANISQLKIKESIHILWEKHSLNHQLAHVNLKSSL